MNGTFTSYAAVLVMPAGQAAQQRTIRRTGPSGGTYYGLRGTEPIRMARSRQPPAAQVTGAEAGTGTRSAQNYFQLPERTRALPYRDTELQFPRDHLTIASPSGAVQARRRLAAYPAVHNASAAMIAVSTMNAPLGPASAPRPATR